jgi:hypothetical protein
MVNLGALIPGLLGTAVQAGMAIPGLKKPKKQNVRPLASRTAGQIVGGAQAGQGATRGLALLSGLRQAGESLGQLSETQYRADIAMEQQYQDSLQARNERFAEFGQNLAKGLGDMSATMLKAKKTEDEKAKENTDKYSYGGTTGYTGYPQAGAGTVTETPVQQALPAPGQGMVQETPEAMMAGMQQQQAAPSPAGGPSAAPQYRPDAGVYSQAPSIDPNVEQALMDQLHMKELILSNAARLGINPLRVVARTNRLLQLQPGQNVTNPYGVSFDNFVNGEEEQY